MAHLSLQDAFEVYKGLGVPKFRGVTQRTSGMNRAAWRRAMKDSKMYKEDELAKCLIAFDGATQGNNIMTFEDFEVALEHAGKQKKMSGSDVGLIIVHKAMKIVEEQSSTGQIERKPTLESLKAEMRKELAKGKQKINMGPPPMPKRVKKGGAPRKPPAPETKPKSGGGDSDPPSSTKDGEKDTEEKKVGEEKKEEPPEQEKKEEEEEDEVDFKAIAARNQYLEEQQRQLAELNAQLKTGEGMTDKEVKRAIKRDKDGMWDRKNPSGSRSDEHCAYWDWS